MKKTPAETLFDLGVSAPARKVSAPRVSGHGEITIPKGTYIPGAPVFSHAIAGENTPYQLNAGHTDPWDFCERCLTFANDMRRMRGLPALTRLSDPE